MVPLTIANTDGQSQEGITTSYRISLGASSLAVNTRQLAVLLRSVMPLSDTLEVLSRQAGVKGDSRARRLISMVRASVREGHSFCDSLRQFPRTFDQLYTASVAAGEQSGCLDRVLKQMAEHTEAPRAFRKKSMAARIYPILLCVSIAIVSGLMIFIVPDVIKVFVDSGQSLPLLTRGLLAVSEFFQSSGLLLVLILAALVAGLFAAMRLPPFRRRVHWLYLHTPLVKAFSRGVNAQRYMQTLGILSQSGVVLHRGMEIAEQVVKNSHLQILLAEVAARVREGESISKALERINYFPPLMVYMLASGEASCELDRMLCKAAEQQAEDTRTMVATMVVF